jgi:hypothetical protein
VARVARETGAKKQEAALSRKADDEL